SGEQVQLSQVTLTVSDTDKVRPIGDIVRDILGKSHVKNDWSVTVPLDRLEEAERAKKRYQVLLAFIASIPLLRAGISIMNILLATVTERTQEIGIRRALGAKRRDITVQFLIEAVVQTTLGGLIGMLLGFVSIYAIPPLFRLIAKSNVPTKLHIPS